MTRNGTNGAVTIVVWQTRAMRGDFELHGFSLHLEFMKQKLNSFEWSYTSVVTVDANGSPRCVAEGISLLKDMIHMNLK